MQRQWTDPRDGTVWLVTVTPHDGREESAAVSFHRPGLMPVWTRRPPVGALDPPVDDDQLMDLLDRARREGSQADPRLRRPSSAPLDLTG